MSEPMSVTDVLKDLKRVYGEELLSILIGVDEKTLRKNINGTLTLTETQKQTIGAIVDIHDLLGSISPIEEKTWWITFNEYYLYGYPAIEIKSRASDVRIAALMKISGRDLT